MLNNTKKSLRFGPSRKLGRILGWGIATLVCLSVQRDAYCAEPISWVRLQQSAVHMGSEWTLALYSDDRKAANQAIDKAWAEVEQVDAALSNYIADSEVNQLCRSAPHSRPVPVSEHLWNVLTAADRVSRSTDGAFDVTIGPLTRLWRRARAKHEMPDAERLLEARKMVDYRLIEYDPSQRAVRLLKEGMQIDLGGIGKGYGVDRALQVLREAGLTRAIVNGGGDIAVGDPPPGEAGWKVAIRGLDRDRSELFVQAANLAIATSGDAWQFLEIDGTRYSHIVDSRTGLGTTRRTAATVLAPNCTQADAWASACCVVGAKRAIELCQMQEGIDCRVVERSEQADADSAEEPSLTLKSVSAPFESRLIELHAAEADSEE